MKEGRRDLLVLTKNLEVNKVAFEQEVKSLNTLLQNVENFKSFCIASEVIDVTRRKISQNVYRFQELIYFKKVKPFVFINNKN
ncbi:MAG: hypothetical protein JSR09_05445 [Bacteroidetes bacterium]|nr:hypothetical protein [Bacteroidota bacterium]MBS1649132.1 hypothetical protein [Bacteroidota bacterium]